MISAPKYSICIPTYNRAHLLPAALESALGQTFPDFEVVVVDNASTDNTQSVLQRYDDSRLRWFQNKNTVSMYANHNRCIDHARAPRIVFLHSDDRLIPEALFRYHEAISFNEEVSIITASSGYFQAYWRSLGSKQSYLLSGAEGIALLFRYFGVNMSGACIRKDVLRKLSGFSEGTVIADHDFYIRTLVAGYDILLLKEGVIDLGLSERSLNTLIAEKKWMFEQGKVIACNLSNPDVINHVAAAIKDWEPREVARLLMLVAAGDSRIILNRLESLEYPVVAAARREKQYRHVHVFKLLGHKGHRKVTQALFKWNQLKKRVSFSS